MALLVSRQESMASGICAGSEPWCLQLRRGTEEKCSNSFVRRGVTANEGEIFNQKADQQVFVYLARDAHIHIAGNNSVLHKLCRSGVFKVSLPQRGGPLQRCFSQSDTRMCFT